METPIETIPYKRMEWDELFAAKFAFDEPFQFHLANGEVYQAEKVIRLVPRRRLIAFGFYAGKPAVAKIFFNPKRAKKHVEKELRGVKGLKENKVPTPEIYYHGLSEDKHSYIMIFRQLVNAYQPFDAWQNKQSVEEALPLLQKLLLELATQHVVGVLQRDLHLKNFLVLGKIIYTIDAAEIDFHPPLLSKQLSMQNLATFFSQLGVDAIPYYDRLFEYYAKSRGWLLKKKDYLELYWLIKKTYEKRWSRLQRKILRESTNCACIHNWKTFAVFGRIHGGTQFNQFIEDPEAVFARTDVTTLKAGRSATVIKVRLDDRDFVIKRYNIKNFFHWLRRAFRPTRARSAWRLAQKLQFYGIPTATPIGFIEKKFLNLKKQSYFITEWVPGKNLLDYFSEAFVSEESSEHLIADVSQLLKNMINAEMTHGDLKGTNILIDATKKPLLIDLDGASEHGSLSSLHTTWQRQAKRFLKNFDHMPAVYQAFARALKV